MTNALAPTMWSLSVYASSRRVKFAQPVGGEAFCAEDVLAATGAASRRAAMLDRIRDT
jgi:hypothetical protein